MDPNDATWITLTARPRSPRAQPTRTQRLLVAVALIGLASVYALAARPDLVAWLLLAATVTTLVAVTLRSARGYRLGRRHAYAETYLAIAGLVSDRAARR
jgi:uncharacterized BrkB/YihY/UPF0761 family membrane protein